MKRLKNYPNYFKNKKLRRENPNVRKIVGGKPISYWNDDKKASVA